MKPLCIYHGVGCIDGFAAAWVVNRFHQGEVDFHESDYGQSPPDVTERNVIIVDFSYPADVLKEMGVKADSIVVLDHHKSAETQLAEFDRFAVEITRNQKRGRVGAAEAFSHCRNDGRPAIAVHFDMGQSGAMLAWKYFFPNEEVPEFITRIQDRDLWLFKYPDTKAVVAALYSFEFSFEQWDQLEMIGLKDLEQLGKALIRNRDKDIAQIIKLASYEIDLCGHRVLVANCPRHLTSELGHVMAIDRSFSVMYWDCSEYHNVSLRGHKDGVDVSLIAESFGGGGHKAAAGYKLKKGNNGPFKPLAIS